MSTATWLIPSIHNLCHTPEVSLHRARRGDWSDSGLVSAAVPVQWNERVSTCAYYDGQLASDNYDSHNVNGGLQVSF